MSNLKIVTEKNDVFEPSASCALSGVFLGANSFSNSSLFIHASSGCGFAMRYGLGQHWKSFLVCPVSSLCDENIIFGSEKLLYKSLTDFLDIHDSEVVFVGTGCSASVIGEDYISVTKELSEKYKKPIVFIDSGGLTGDLVKGYNNFLESIVKYFHSNDIPIYQKQAIDICGIIPMYDMFWRGNINELKRLFQKLDIKINSFFTGDIDLKAMKNIYNSQLLISIDQNVGKKMMCFLKNKTNTPIKIFPYSPIGINNTKMFLEEICMLLNMDQEVYSKKIESEVAIARKTISRGFDFSKVMFTSGRYALIGDAAKVIPMVDFLSNEIGMKCVMIAFTHRVGQKEIADLEGYLSKRSEDINNIAVLNGEDNLLIRKTLKEIAPNLVFGRSIDRVSEMKKTVHITWQFPASDHFVLYDRPIMGFKGTTSIVDYIVNGFSKIWY